MRCTCASSRPSSGSTRRTAGRSRRAPRPPRLRGRAVAARGPLLPRGRAARARAAVLSARRWIGCERALEALGHIPDTSESRALAVDLRLRPRGGARPAGRACAGPRRAAVGGGDRGRSRTTSGGWRARSPIRAPCTGRSATRRPPARRAGARSPSRSASRISASRWWATYSLGGAIRALGDYPRAAASCGGTWPCSRATGQLRDVRSPRAGVRDVAQPSRVEPGRARGVRRGHRARRGRRYASPRSRATAIAWPTPCLGLGGTLLRRGRCSSAAPACSRAVSRCARRCRCSSRRSPAISPSCARSTVAWRRRSSWRPRPSRGRSAWAASGACP